MFGYHKLYIDGKLLDAEGERKQPVHCPATDEVVGEVAWAGSADTRKALDSAQTAFPLWSGLSVKERVSYMLRLRELVTGREEELRTAEMYEHGKTYAQTEEGYQRVLDTLEYYAVEIQRKHGHLLVDLENTHEHKIIYQAAGVVGAFVAWNFPLLNLAFKLGPAMAAGCPLILRPAPETPLTAYMIGELCAKAELPPGAVQVLTGPVAETAEVISRSPIPAMLTLIGSTATGCKVMTSGAASVKRYSMELGGNAPALVFADADLELAASLIVILKTANTGQICVTPNRILVHESIHDAFLSRVLEKVQAIKIGHGRDSAADMGPLIHKQARERIHNWVEEAVRDGARLCYGGRIPPGMEDKGAYYMPTVLDQVSDTSKLCCDEVFGPVLSISSFGSYDEAIARANDTQSGLASYVFSRDGNLANQAARELNFGEVQINGVKYAIDLPHMGIKQSGVGQDCSHFALEDYLVKKRITTAL